MLINKLTKSKKHKLKQKQSKIKTQKKVRIINKSKKYTEEKEEGECTPEESPQFLSTKSLDNLILEETNEEPIKSSPCVITPSNDYV